MRAGDKKYSDLLGPDRISIDIQASTKHAVIDEMIDMLGGHPAVTSIDDVRRSVHDREALMSTGVGSGLALPHAKTVGVSETIAAFGIIKPGIEFESVDGLPVELAFLLVGPESARSEHIRVLSWISRLMNRAEVRESLLRADSPDAVMSIFQSEGEHLVTK